MQWAKHRWIGGTEQNCGRESGRKSGREGGHCGARQRAACTSVSRSTSPVLRCATAPRRRA
eukprot:595063-Pyramimonas_sp.AAC.3